jgi:ADP-heptose:LPS heptosyltransferase
VRILLVRLRPIGDVVFTTPLLDAIRRQHADVHLAYAVEPAAAPVLEGHPAVDDLLIVPRSRGLARVREDLAIARRLNRMRFDIAIDLHGGPRAAFFTWASGAPMRIGYTIAGRTWMYTHPVPRARRLTPRHSVLNQWDLLAPLGIPHGSPSLHPVRMVENEAAAGRVAARLARAGVGPDHPLVVIHVSASSRFKRWPEESFVALVAALVARDPMRRIQLVSGPSDPDGGRRVAEAARARLGDRAGALLEPSPFELSELRPLIARAALYIGADSGPLHVAATTDTPIVELLGPTLAERSHPWRDPRWPSEVLDAGPLPCRPCQQRRCIPGDFRCLTGITPDRVLEAAERALAWRSPVARDGSNPRRMPVTA